MGKKEKLGCLLSSTWILTGWRWGRGVGDTKGFQGGEVEPHEKSYVKGAAQLQPQTPLNHYPPPSQESKERSMDGSDCGQEVREGNRVSDEGGDWGEGKDE